MSEFGQSVITGLKQAMALTLTETLEHRGYSAVVVFDSEDEILTGHVADIPAGVGFHASDAAGLRVAFQETVDDYIDMLASASGSAR
jgi:predicted HicB family RNase H-like nuclease